MKKLAIALVLLFAGGTHLYNSNWFQAFFHNKSFYKNIAEVSFDVTTKGEQIVIPINFKYNTCYELGIQLPRVKAFNSKPTGKGQLGYRFVSDGKVVADGITRPVPRHGWGGDDHYSIRKLMVFDLPFPKVSHELYIELEVIEPFVFMEEYKRQTSIVISPNYEPKFNKCYNEDLRIEYSLNH